jgi:large subunit ribosomal protein L24
VQSDQSHADEGGSLSPDKSRKKHQKQVQSQGRTLKPGVIEFEAPIAIGNVMLVCPKCDNPVRVGVQREDDESQRICKNCGAVIE